MTEIKPTLELYNQSHAIVVCLRSLWCCSCFTISHKVSILFTD